MEKSPDPPGFRREAPWEDDDEEVVCAAHTVWHMNQIGFPLFPERLEHLKTTRPWQ